jgi:hypothetical protein
VTSCLDLGDRASGSRAFQTLAKSSLSSGTYYPTSEEMHYQYDSSGRLTNSAFAQTPAISFTPTGTNSWYDSTHRASVRARAYYAYDPAGRNTYLEHYWDTWNSGTSAFDSAPILGYASAYETSGTNRGLKTSTGYYNNSSGSWNLIRTETYGYEAERDFLTSANYNDGNASATPSYTYDQTGNRLTTSCVFNKLNEQRDCGGFYYWYDAVGNRTARQTKTTNVPVAEWPN